MSHTVGHTHKQHTAQMYSEGRLLMGQEVRQWRTCCLAVKRVWAFRHYSQSVLKELAYDV